MKLRTVRRSIRLSRGASGCLDLHLLGNLTDVETGVNSEYILDYKSVIELVLTWG